MMDDFRDVVSVGAMLRQRVSKHEGTACMREGSTYDSAYAESQSAPSWVARVSMVGIHRVPKMTGARTTSICLSAGSTAIGPSTLCVVIMSKRKELPLSETYVRPKYILQKIPEASLFFLSINPHRRKSHQIRYEGW